MLALRGPELDFRELKLLLEQRCRELCAGTGLRIRIDGRLESPELVAFHEQVLPSCFELVSNAARHARPRQVELELDVDASEVRIRVNDDGAGLSLDVWRDSAGGLRGVRERVRRLGGDIELASSASGTRFLLRLPRPLRSAAPAEGS
ncbi:MAG: ATP-binding protein [Polyangiaceae bacterium]